jgi:hypothetical protein
MAGRLRELFMVKKPAHWQLSDVGFDRAQLVVDLGCILTIVVNLSPRHGPVLPPSAASASSRCCQRQRDRRSIVEILRKGF